MAMAAAVTATGGGEAASWWSGVGVVDADAVRLGVVVGTLAFGTVCVALPEVHVMDTIDEFVRGERVSGMAGVEDDVASVEVEGGVLKSTDDDVVDGVDAGMMLGVEAVEDILEEDFELDRFGGAADVL